MASTSIKDINNDYFLKINPDGSINADTTGGGGASNVNLTQVGGSGITLGQNTEANSLPVVIASNQSPITVTGSTTVSGSVNSTLEGLNSFQTSQYSIGLTAVQLAPTPLSNRSSISITVTAAANVAVFIGNSSSVTTSTGYPLYNGSTLQLDLTPTGNIWAITGTASQTIAVLEIA